MSSNLRKVPPGDPLAIPAATFNGSVDAAKAIVQKPLGVYVEKAHDLGDFAGLGIAVRAR